MTTQVELEKTRRRLDREHTAGCSCGNADYGAEGHDGDPAEGNTEK